MDTLITNIGQLVTPVARHTAKAGGNSRADVVIDAGGGAVMPGLVDPHCHLRPVATDENAGPDSSQQSLPDLLRRALRCGTTTLGLKCRDSASVFEEMSDLKHAARGRVPRIVASLFCVPRPGRSDDSDGRMSSVIGEAIPTVRTRRLAQFCDVAVGDTAYSLTEARAILRAARGAGLRLKLTVDGGSVEEALRLAAKLETTSIDFCAAPLPPSIERMRSVDVIPVLLPSRFFVPRLAAPDIRPMLERDLSLALGTDHGATSPGVGSQWMILAIAITQLNMTLGEAITACTYNGARALGLGSETGTLEVGKKADLIVLDVADYLDLMDELGRNPVEMAMVEGQVVYQR